MPIQDWVVRHPTIQDAPRVLDLMVRRDKSECGESDSSLDDLLFDWSRVDLDRDAWLVFTEMDGLAGYGAVLPWGTSFRYDVCTDPAWQGKELGQALVGWCQERGLALTQERQVAAAITYVAHQNHQGREIVEKAGFRPVKHYFQMQARLDSPLSEPQWPEGVHVRAASPGQDDEAIYALIRAAFERPGRMSLTFDDWQAVMMRPDTFKPDLWFLAAAGGQIVGACLCYEYPGQGVVLQLGVTANWRRRGIGAALLLHAFREFKQRGFGKVALAVASDNPNACQFYQHVGMKCVRQYEEYEKGFRQ